MLRVYATAEYNDKGWLVYAENYPGAFVRGVNKAEALGKFRREMRTYLRWRDGCCMDTEPVVILTREVESALHIEDADSDVLFESERLPLDVEEYQHLKSLALKSAGDFERLYESAPEKDRALCEARATFYGTRPVTAREMYEHTNSVTAYYCGEIEAEMENCPSLVESREAAFQAIEAMENYLDNKVFDGSYDELWSLRKVLRRFLWHDRIHAKALYRGAVKLWGEEGICNSFCFEITKKEKLRCIMSSELFAAVWEKTGGYARFSSDVEC